MMTLDGPCQYVGSTLIAGSLRLVVFEVCSANVLLTSSLFGLESTNGFMGTVECSIRCVDIVGSMYAIIDVHVERVEPQLMRSTSTTVELLIITMRTQWSFDSLSSLAFYSCVWLRNVTLVR